MSDESVQVSTRDPLELATRLGRWLTGVLDADTVTVTGVDRPLNAGFSSETLLVDLSWSKRCEVTTAQFVLRLPPPTDAFPLFPTYDIERQAAAMRFVRSRGSVPVPAIPFLESDAEVLGAPFLVMERVDGRAVPDMPPYVFGSWLSEAAPDLQEKVAQGLVGVIVGIHDAATPADDVSFLALDVPGRSALERHVVSQREYYDWIRGDQRFPVIDQAFAWLDAHWPADEGTPVISWGDARLANVLWRDFAPMAVLDWESVAVGPRELDLGWAVFFHEYFQRFADQHGVVGMPEFMLRDDVVSIYERLTGHHVSDLDWFVVYAELRQALVSIRVSSRQVHFGEVPAPDDPEQLIMQGAHLAVVTSEGGEL